MRPCVLCVRARMLDQIGACVTPECDPALECDPFRTHAASEFNDLGIGTALLLQGMLSQARSRVSRELVGRPIVLQQVGTSRAFLPCPTHCAAAGRFAPNHFCPIHMPFY